MQEDLIALLSTWIYAQHTEAQMFYIQHDLYSSSVNVTGNRTSDLKESKPKVSVPEVQLSVEGQNQTCSPPAKGKGQTNSILNSVDQGPEHTLAACYHPVAPSVSFTGEITAPVVAAGGGAWTERWSGQGQVCWRTSSMDSQFDPWCWNPSKPARWGNQGAQWEACSVTLERALPRVPSISSQVEFVTQDRGGAAEHASPGGLKSSTACQEPALCCHYPLQLMRHCRVTASFTHRGGFAHWKSWGGRTRSQPSSSSRMTSVRVHEIRHKAVKTCKMVSFVFHSPFTPRTYFSSTTSSPTRTCRWNVCASVTVSSKILQTLL